MADRAKAKPLLVVVSPFLDKGHGTERIVVEWISSLADRFEIHVYSQHVEDLDLRAITWHRIPKLPGPHLLNYLWWFVANHAWRSWDRRFCGIRPDLVFSPGINCLDADVVSVHIVFAEYAESLASELKLSTHPFRLWPQLLHRKLYYRLIGFLEARLYRKPQTTLIPIAGRTARVLRQYYGRRMLSPVIYAGIDLDHFNPKRRASLRDKARTQFGCSSQRLVLLLIGNDWGNKGLPVLLQALELLRDLSVDLLVVGREDPAQYENLVRAKGLDDRVQFRLPRTDVEMYYAAADAYVGPSREDAFALPPAEAMACGLPVIVSSKAGVSEIVTHGIDGLVLEDPTDARALASMIRKLYEDPRFGAQIAGKAAETARRYTWESSCCELNAVFEDLLRKKSHAAPESVVQES